MPPLLPGADGHLLAMRPGQALLPGLRRHSALRALLAPDAPCPVRPLRQQPGRVGAHPRRPAAMRVLQPAASAVQHVRQDPYRRGPASSGPLVQHVLPQGPGIVPALHELRDHRTPLPHHGLCIGCAVREHLLSLLSHDQGGMHPHAEAIYHVLAASDPDSLMQWLTRSSAAAVLAGISQAGHSPGQQELQAQERC
ncbi:MAG: hypothetical protein JWM19_5521 [Actinomycetia bacterium]|nr:hypothetical protein [Actinomycetes bacterium]